MENILRVGDLKKVYGSGANQTHALKGVSFDIEKGEYVGIMGASGSGKTTLLNCISTIDTATAGQIIIEGQDITKLRGAALADFRCRKLGFIFQDYNLLDTMNAFENIALALTIAKTPANDVEPAVRKVSAQLGIEDVLNKYPVQMSGGQRQRVASARAIVTNPALVLADEPTGALDSKSSAALLESFRHMVQTLQTTILMVTHDPFSASYTDRIIFIKDGQLFTQLERGADSRKVFFDKLIEVVGELGGSAE
ncbi:MAG: ABC transporter ATP-binding protein [Oscillospiraceae bacterium]|jgi:putative ABC transport system ATP-binding protein|nr:ABC transporter ATP-binding protein [Oscillospiraceae bacterium]